MAGTQYNFDQVKDSTGVANITFTPTGSSFPSNGMTLSDVTAGTTITVVADTSRMFPQCVIPSGFGVTVDAVGAGTNPGLFITMGPWVFQPGSSLVMNGTFLSL